MDKALEQEVQAMIAGAVKPVTDQVGQLAKAVEPVGALVTQVADLGKSVKVVADTLEKLPPANPKDAGAAGAGAKTATQDGQDKVLSLADITKLLDERDAKRAGSAKRDAFIAEKLKGIPAAYHGLLGTDESQWAAQEQAIRQQVQADLKALGVQVPNMGGAPETKNATEIAKPHELPAEEFAKQFLPKVPGTVVDAK